MNKKSAKIIDDSNLRNVTKALHAQKRDCAQSVSLLQNSDVPKFDMAQSVYLLQNNEMFENEIKNRQKFTSRQQVQNLKYWDCPGTLGLRQKPQDPGTVPGL